ncbi:MAG: ABC transporter substrate-binding protein [Candidatus Sulfotelmatobacter sp.]
MIRGYLLIATLLWTGLITTQATTQEHGREIYRRGTLAGSSVGTAAIGADGVPLPSSSSACATCHGTHGEGGRESGIDAPPLNWKRLTSTSVSSVTGRRRDAYTRESLRRAITAGVDPSGARLYPGMPRYTMPEKDLTELVAYLEGLGDDQDTDPGVTATSIRIGVALPLSGPLQPAGQSIRETLERVFAEASRDGGIYGRSVDLVAEDSLGTAAGLLDATRRLVTDDRVFAVAGSLHAGNSADAVRLLESAEVPLIGPVGLSPHETGVPNAYVFYLLPSLYDQARAIVDFIVARDVPRRPRLAVIYGATDFDRDVVEGLRTQAALHGLEIVAEARYASDKTGAVLSKQPDYLIFSGDGAGIAVVARNLDQTSSATVLIGFISTTQSGIASLPPRVAAHALLAAPALPPDSSHAAAFFSLLQAGHFPKTYLGFRSAAFAASSVLVQALRSSGSRPNRDELVRTLEHLQHFETGVTAPLTFGPNQRAGSTGAVILALDPTSHDYVAVSCWITPKAGR